MTGSELPEDLPHTAEPAARATPVSRLFFVLGAIGLVGALLSDASAVVGRNLGHPLLGSIELVEGFIVLAAGSAMVGATLSGNHATVHILLERLSPRGRRVLETFAALLAAIAFGVLFVGSAWLTADLWHGQEQTELLGVPLKPLRLFWCAAALIMTGLFLRRAAKALLGRGAP